LLRKNFLSALLETLFHGASLISVAFLPSIRKRYKRVIKVNVNQEKGTKISRTLCKAGLCSSLLAAMVLHVLIKQKRQKSIKKFIKELKFEKFNERIHR
jgi:hypothetical protein